MSEDQKTSARRVRVRPKVNKLRAAVEAERAAEEKARETPVVAAQDARGDPRGDLRGDMRASSSRDLAELRAAEILSHIGDIDEGTDEFYIPPEIIPDGWDYEWKRRLLLNKEDPAYEVAVARTGWTAVPASRHPSMMPAGTPSHTIERKGMILMERPKIITERARAADARKAAMQVRGKEDQLSLAPKGQFGRDNKGSPLVSVGRQYEAIPIPK